jgi:DNA ligase-4
MGAASTADAYDDEQIFAHLVFYLDTSENAERNGLQSPSTSESFAADKAETDRQLYKAGDTVKRAGGKLVGRLDDASLTHIIASSDTRR